MARPLTCHSSYWNLFPTAGNELAGPAPTEGNDTYILATVVSHAPTSTPASAPALLLALTPVDANATVRYSKAELQPIFKTILEVRSPILALAPQILVFSKSPYKRPLKARFPELYYGKTHMECYNFCQQCKDYFATTGAKRPHRVLFITTLLRDQALFRLQQYKQKIDGETTNPITWKELKVFFCQSLGKSPAFVNSIWRTIKRDS